VERPELPAGHPGACLAGGVPAGRAAGVPGAGGAVRELDPAAGGDPDRADDAAVGAGRRVAGRGRQQRVRAGGPGGADGPGLQERDPDRGVRPRAGAAGPAGPRGRAGGLPPASAPDRDDLGGVHRRHRPAGAVQRRRRRGALDHRRDRVRRHARRDPVRPVPDPGVLRGPAQAGRPPAGLACATRATGGRRHGAGLRSPPPAPPRPAPRHPLPPRHPMTTPSRTALATRATRGIGLETVRQLAQAGVHTLLAGRNPTRTAAAAAVRERHGRLDILVNNAGILRDAPGLRPSEQAAATWRATFETNLFGVVEVTRAFLPLLHAAPAGRIVNVSSILGSLALHSDPDSPVYDLKLPAYNVSKAALNAWTVQLAWELRDSRIRVNAVHPGYVRTDMNAGEGELDVAEGARTSVRLALAGEDAPNGGFFHVERRLPW